MQLFLKNNKKLLKLHNNYKENRKRNPLFRVMAPDFFHQTAPAGIRPVEDGRAAQRCGHGVIALSVFFPGPQVNPAALREIHFPLGLSCLPYGSNQHVRAEEIFKLLGQAARVVFVVQEERCGKC